MYSFIFLCLLSVNKKTGTILKLVLIDESIVFHCDVNFSNYIEINTEKLWQTKNKNTHDYVHNFFGLFLFLFFHTIPKMITFQ